MPKEILIYGSIVNDDQRELYKNFYGEDHEMMTPRMLKEDLDEARGDDVLLRVNSTGGHSDAGFAMQSILRSYPGKVEALIDGMAASAATMPLMADNVHVKIAKNAGMMVHLNSFIMIDRVNSKSLQEAINSLENYDRRLAQSYADKTGMSADEWLAEMQSDLYLLADEAKEFGLVDDVVGASDTPIAYSPRDIKNKAKMPSCLRNRLKTFEELRGQKEYADQQRRLVADLDRLKLESSLTF